MFSSKLPPPLTVDGDFNTTLDHFYEVFKSRFMNKEVRPELFGKFIFVNCKNWIDYKSETFWHLVAFDEGESGSFNILPCNNDVAGQKCPVNCINKLHTVELNHKKRDICFYRGARINWINQIIDLANKRDPNIQLWRKKEYNKRVTKEEEKTYIRFKHEGTDYLIVLAEKKDKHGKLLNYHFVTAFPVFYLNKKRTYDEDYANFVIAESSS